MALWTPEAEAGPNETVGRRLFDEPALTGAKGQKPFAGLRLDNFEDGREDREFSLDRLGRSNPESAVIGYLRPRAEAAGQKFQKPKRFNGWAAIQVKHLSAGFKGIPLTVTVSAIDGVGLEQNIYHAHVRMPEPLSPYFFALHIRYLMERYGRVLDPFGIGR